MPSDFVGRFVGVSYKATCLGLTGACGGGILALMTGSRADSTIARHLERYVTGVQSRQEQTVRHAAPRHHVRGRGKQVLAQESPPGRPPTERSEI